MVVSIFSSRARSELGGRDLLIWSQGRKNRACGRSRTIRHGERAGVASFVCLIAVLAQLSLPLAHTAFHLLKNASTPVEVGGACSSSCERHDAAVARLISTDNAVSHHSQHDPSKCPLCQTLQRSSNFTVPHHPPASSVSAIAGLVSSNCSDLVISGCNLGGCGPRAPPHLS